MFRRFRCMLVDIFHSENESVFLQLLKLNLAHFSLHISFWQIYLTSDFISVMKSLNLQSKAHYTERVRKLAKLYLLNIDLIRCMQVQHVHPKRT